MNYELTLTTHEKRTAELFGDIDTLELHTVPIETLEAMKNHYLVSLSYLGELKTTRGNALNESKTALKIILTEKKIEHLKDLTGSDKARIATLYAERDCETEIKGIAILENEYKEVSNRYSVYDTIIRSLTQTISVVKNEIQSQQFIKGK